MDAGGLAQMAHAPFSGHGLAIPSGLATRRGSQNIKPLSFDGMSSQPQDNGLPTPRTSRSHLLAGLRTAPKSATASNFPLGPSSPTVAAPSRNRNSMTPGMYDNSNLYGGPKTALPRFNSGQQQQQQQYQMYNNNNNQAMGFGQQHYTADQILAPPQIQLDEAQEQIDPNVHAQLLYTNAYLTEQKLRLQQHLLTLQAAAQQFQGLSLSGQAQMMQQAYAGAYQQQAQNLQAMMTPATAQANFYSVYDPLTSQLYMDHAQAQMNAQLANQQALANAYANVQQANAGAPRVQVSPPPAEKPSFRNPSPPRRHESPAFENPAPLPPPSANAFRRGHKKSSSTANNKGMLSIATDESLKSAGPKTASFPLTPSTAGYGPGQNRAGEHPIRQPRNPPSMDELKSKPTSKHEGSKNFVTRTRRSAVHNLVKAGLERRKEARSSGSISPISETSEELVETPMTDNDSDSGRSGSGSLIDRDEAESSLPSSRTSTGSWGAIGSDRPRSRQKFDRSADSPASDNESSQAGSFASLLKSRALEAAPDAADGQRKAPMLVLTSAAEKRKMAA